MKTDMKKSEKKKISGVVVFDFDGTLSAGDANVGFWKYCFMHSFRAWLFLPVVLCGALVRAAAFFGSGESVRGVDVMWRHMMRMFLTPGMVGGLSPGFIARHKLNRFGWAADMVARERARGNIAVMVSASPDYLLLPLIRGMGFDYVICSDMDRARPWKYKFLCYGGNKSLALDALFAGLAARGGGAKGPKIVRAYSDSASDMPVMRRAREMVWIDPETGLRKTQCARRGRMANRA
jgi:phosphoserine phosphatase